MDVDPNYVRAQFIESMRAVVPVFKAGSGEASAGQIALVMRLTGTYTGANDDDVGNILVQMGVPSNFRGNNMYFNLAEYERYQQSFTNKAGGKK